MFIFNYLLEHWEPLSMPFVDVVLILCHKVLNSYPYVYAPRSICTSETERGHL